jgi:hypothetical protein
VFVVATCPSESKICTVTAGDIVDPDATFVGCCKYASCEAAGTTTKLLDVAPVNPAPVADNVCVPAPDKIKFENDADPFTAATLVVPLSTPDPLPRLMVIVAAESVTRFPLLSSTYTTTAGEIAAFTLVVDGCVTNTSFDAAPLITNVPVAADSVPSLAVSVYVPIAENVRPLNVATPFTAVAVIIPETVPPPGPVPQVSVTAEFAVVIVLPPASVMFTVNVGTVTPADALIGDVGKISFDASPTVTVKLFEFAVAEPAVAFNVYVPAFASDTLENVATPPTAFTVVVPVNVPPEGPLTIDSVTAELSVVSMAPVESVTFTTTGGKIAPAVTLDTTSANVRLVVVDVLPVTVIVPVVNVPLGNVVSVNFNT